MNPTLRLIPLKAARTLCAWLVAVLLLTQVGAVTHVFSHLTQAESQVALASATPDGDAETGGLHACAQCLALSLLDHAAPSPDFALPQSTDAAGVPLFILRAGLPADAPAARSRAPPLSA